MSSDTTDTHQKAFQINMDLEKYGTFAEIGAGQEVARHFFRVGGAAGTVAKTMSAYDMTFSDAIYGSSERYVSRQRLQTMLNYEYRLLQERLGEKRGATTTFFVFADTVTARSYSRKDEAHGWIGIQFQTKPLRQPSQIIVHVRMLDQENIQEQEALGAIGVNLIHGAFFLHREPSKLIRALMDSLSPNRIEVDVIKFSGPDFEGVDNRLMNLLLVQKGIANAVVFTPDGEVAQSSEIFYNKPVLVERGSFRPVNLLNLDMLRCGLRRLESEPAVQNQPIVEVMEMTMRNLLATGEIDDADFLARMDLLAALGKTVMVSNYARFYPLAAHLSRCTKKMIGIVMGVPTLREIFNEKYYADLEGGILESFGRLFKSAVKLYIYPWIDEYGNLTTADTLRVSPHLHHLYAYLQENQGIESLEGYDSSLLPIHSQEILDLIQSGDPAWEATVPPPVVQMIKARGYYGWSPK